MGSHRVQRAASPPLNGRRILVVEDDGFIADAVANLLAQEGADVFGPAATVAEGAQLADYWPIDIAVMDLNLHGQRADHLVVELARKGITVVVVTGYVATLKKPVTSAHLLDTLYQAANSAHHGAIATATIGADPRLPRTG